ncbi:hypothetical protein MMC09_002072 [Bachmanniomyces sp. S44760]|nr:hypothetical protein [Bachmanniomyces sp. S44760]
MTATLDAFANFDNLFAVYVGNEVISDSKTSISAPYIKAAGRDIKAYRDGQNYRPIPVGYAAVSASNLLAQQNYLACGDNASQALDFFSINHYSWCGNSSFTESGYSELYSQTEGYSIPIFFSETGCNIVGHRAFQDQSAILGPQMNDIWSGAIVYEWPQEKNSYGIVSYTSSGPPYKGTPEPISPDKLPYWDTLTPTGTPSSEYTSTYPQVACPTSSSGFWSVDAAATLPTIQGLVITSKPPTSSASGSSSTSTGNGLTTPPPDPDLTGGGAAVGNAQTGLSEASKIAIGVTVPIVAGLLGIAAFFYLWRRKRSRAAPTGPNYERADKTELAGEEIHQLHGTDYRNQLEGTPIAQLDAIKTEVQTPRANGVVTYEPMEPQEMAASPIAERRDPPTLI